MSISAYISIFDDWELLKPALWSINDLVDEIVVVDGAYEWMVPSLKTDKKDPSRSSDEVYDILGTFGRKIRVIRGLWRNEPHKRGTGFEACQGNRILRSDADEIVFWDPTQLEAFLTSGFAVAQTEIPIYAYPGKILSPSHTSPIERLSFLFDRTQITAAQHLSYLWLVLPEQERKTLEAIGDQLIFRDPIAFTAHLTHWRSPVTAVKRARFYVLNYIRTHGNLPWLRSFQYNDSDSFNQLFELISPAAFEDILMGDEIVAAPPRHPDMIMRPSGRPEASDRGFSILYDNMLAGLIRSNDELAKRPRAIANGVAYFIDASCNRSISNIQNDGTVTLTFADEVKVAHVEFSEVFPDSITRSASLTVNSSEKEISFLVPPIDYTNNPPIRRTLKLNIDFDVKTITSKFWSGTC